VSEVGEEHFRVHARSDVGRGFWGSRRAAKSRAVSRIMGRRRPVSDLAVSLNVSCVTE
jgi:hypothetical protein